MRHDQPSTSDVAPLLSLTEDELLVRVGEQLTGSQAMPLQPNELIERAQRWFNAQQIKIREQVCANPAVVALKRDESDTVTIAVEVAKVLAGLFLPVNPVVVAVLIVKKGLRLFCEST